MFHRLALGLKYANVSEEQQLHIVICVVLESTTVFVFQVLAACLFILAFFESKLTEQCC